MKIVNITITDVDIKNDAEFGAAVEEYRKICNSIDNLTAAKKVAGARLMKYADAHEIKRGSFGGCIFLIVERIQRTIDSKRLRDEHPEIAAQYERETYSRFPKVK